MISKEAFLTGIETLQTAFQYKMTDDQFLLYHKVISERVANDVQFMRTVDFILVNETRFPAIATFNKYANETPTITDEQREKNMRKAMEPYNHD
jgi:hypothetical protein